MTIWKGQGGTIMKPTSEALRRDQKIYDVLNITSSWHNPDHDTLAKNKVPFHFLLLLDALLSISSSSFFKLPAKRSIIWRIFWTLEDRFLHNYTLQILRKEFFFRIFTQRIFLQRKILLWNRHFWDMLALKFPFSEKKFYDMYLQTQNGI